GKITYTLSVDTTTNKATAVVTNQTDCTIPMSLSVYKMFDTVLSHQEFFDGDGVTDVPANHTFTADLPTCMAQVDFWYGQFPTTLLDSNPYGHLPPPVVLTWKFTHNTG